MRIVPNEENHSYSLTLEAAIVLTHTQANEIFQSTKTI
jgi:hypothetical protein